MKLVWHQGDSKPPGWVPEWGGRSQLFIGDKGMLLGNGKLLPEEKFKDFQTPPETLPRSPGHWVEWVNYAKGVGPVPGSNFQYSGWTTEANHLGNVAYRTGKKIEWDYKNLRARNAPEAAPFIKRPEYRKGWEDILKTYLSEIDMSMTRRDFVKQASGRVGGRAGDRAARRHASAAQTQGDGQPAARAGRDDRLEPRASAATSRKIALAREIGLDGIQVSVQYPTDGKTPTLRDPKTQAAFKRAALENGIQICSLAIGNRRASRGCRCTPIRPPRSCSSRRSRSPTTSAPTTSCCRFSATATST